MKLKYLKTFEGYSKPILKYYAFDIDDNLLYMSTVIHMEKLIDGNWIPTDVSTSQYTEIRNDNINWRLLNNDQALAYSDFRDYGPRGNKSFLMDLKSAISNKKYAPAWGDFIECLINGCLFAIITARGHKPRTIRKGIEYIIDTQLSEEQLYTMYNNLLKFSYIFDSNDNNPKILKGKPSENELVKIYLDNCDFVGVSDPDRGVASASSPEAAKVEALLDFQVKINNFAKIVGVEAMIGFSDDDTKNIKKIEDLFDNLNKEMFSNISKYVVKNTNDPENITSKVYIETSNQTSGLESSTISCSQFGNMTNRLYPKGPLDRQNDLLNSLRQQTDYLNKTSQEIFGKKSKKKIKKSKKIEENRTYYELCEYKNEMTYDLLQDIKQQNKIEFKVISDKQYHIALKEFMKYGKFIGRFPVKYIYEWKDLISDNIIKLAILTELCGHSIDFPYDCFEDVFDYDGKFTDWKQKKYEETNEEDYLKKYNFHICYEYMYEVFNIDELLPEFSNGQDTISDYGLEPLEKLMKEMSEQDTPEEIIVTINKIMDVSHQRSDLAELFIEGGSKTLSYISNE